MSSSNSIPHPHVAFLPSGGMGHLTPTLRLAASLLDHHCQVTLITTHPIASRAETKLISRFLSAFPQVKEEQFHLLPFDPSTANSKDPFFLQWESIRRSVHLLSPLLSSISPSVLIADVSLMSPIIPVAASLRLPLYILFPSSARIFSLIAHYPTILSQSSSDSVPSQDIIQLPGGKPIPRSSLPPMLLSPKSLFASIFIEDGKKLKNVDGILINTFEILESETLNALKSGQVQDGLNNVHSVGIVPSSWLQDFEREGSIVPSSWLQDQPDGSVVYVSFGSRVAVSREQMREIGNGLVNCGSPFIWVVKDKALDKDDDEDLEKILGEELVERIKCQGLVVKEWVDQAQILAHKAVGAFVTHSGWNSVMEAAWNGVPLLAWPQFGDQRINVQSVESSGLGLWPSNWGWAGDAVVKADEIGSKIKEIMGNESFKLKAAKIKEETRKAAGPGGSCENTMKELIELWKNGHKL